MGFLTERKGFQQLYLLLKPNTGSVNFFFFLFCKMDIPSWVSNNKETHKCSVMVYWDMLPSVGKVRSEALIPIYTSLGNRVLCES